MNIKRVTIWRELRLKEVAAKVAGGIGKGLSAKRLDQLAPPGRRAGRKVVEGSIVRR